jgi:hypothetical protein
LERKGKERKRKEGKGKEGKGKEGKMKSLLLVSCKAILVTNLLASRAPI